MNGEKHRLPSNHQSQHGEMVLQQSSYHSGPLPAPEDLQKYDNILPGLANRIVEMAERQSNHRQTIENRVVWFDNIRSTFGPIFGLVIALAGIAAGSYLILNGKSAEGLTSILTPLGVIVGAFVYQQWSKR